MFQILIVDDEHTLLNGCSFMIREIFDLPFPVSISTALNVPNALAVLKNETPDLIITDIRMPVMDGFVLINQIRTKNLPSDIVILTSHADFEYARTAIKYNITDFILKPINEEILKTTILKSYEKKQTRLKTAYHSYYIRLQTMLLYEISASDLLLTEEILTEMFPCTYFTVLVISPKVFPENIDSCKILLQEYYNTCYAYPLKERNQLVFVCNHENFFIKPASLPDKLYQAMGTPLLCGISISSNSVHKIHALYINACQRVFYQEVFEGNDSLARTAAFSYQDCIQIFVENEEDKMRATLYNNIERVQLVKQPSRVYLEQIFISFFQNINLYLKNKGIPDPFNPIPSLPDGIDTFEQLSNYMLNLICQKKEEMKKLWMESENVPLLRQLMEFIKENYQKDLSLDDLAEATGFHPNYISNFFKKTTGQSYLTYLHKERIAVAKQLLSSSSNTIDEIAHKVGYNSSTQFARIFRKYESVSPSDYRNINM